MNINLPMIRAVADEIRGMLGDDCDEATLLDTLDGETDVMDVIEHVLHQRAEAKAFEAASKDVVADYTARARRMADKQTAMNKALGAILDATGQAKVAHPLATISRTRGRKTVVITEEAAVPTQLCKVVTSPDKAAILAQLDAGETVPGADIQIGEPGVAVRVR